MLGIVLTGPPTGIGLLVVSVCGPKNGTGDTGTSVVGIVFGTELKLSVVCIKLATGCDGNAKMMSCTSTTTQNGIVTKTSYDIEYVDDEVKYVTITYDYSSTNDKDDMDGVNADTDGLSENKDNNNARARTNNNDNNMDNNQNNSIVKEGTIKSYLNKWILFNNDTFIFIISWYNK